MVNLMNPLTAAMMLPPAGMQPTGASGESKDSIVSSHSSLGGKPHKDKVTMIFKYAVELVLFDHCTLSFHDFSQNLKCVTKLISDVMKIWTVVGICKWSQMTGSIVVIILLLWCHASINRK